MVYLLDERVSFSLEEVFCKAQLAVFSFPGFCDSYPEKNTMDLTRRTLEGEFGTTSRGTPQQDSSIIIGESSSRKRRLSHVSFDKTIPNESVTRKYSVGTPNSFVISVGEGKSPVAVDALMRENSRLKFELDNANALQNVLESNIRTLRDQLFTQRSLSMHPQKDSEQEKISAKDGLEHQLPLRENNHDEVAALKAMIEENESEMISIQARLEDQIAKLQNSLSVSDDEKSMISNENESLRAKLLEMQEACAACHAECRSLKEAMAQQEAETLKQNFKPPFDESHQNELEIRLLEEKINRLEADAAAGLTSASQKLEEAQSKIRCLEQLIQSQDESHLDLLKTRDELENWRSLFNHVEKDITPKALLRYLREIETKVYELEKSKMTSPKNLEKSAEKIEILENNVSSLQEENLHLKKKLKEQSNPISDEQENKYIERIDSLTEEVINLKEKLGSGHFNSETTKVLHMKKNPYHDHKMNSLQAQITCLDAENKVLQSRLEEFEAGSHAGVTAETELRMAQMQGEITLLQKKLTEVQKGSERLKQVFTRQIAMLRESIPKIFGYQLEMVSDPNSKDTKAMFTLHPQGSQSNAKVVFKLLYDGSMSLVENDFTKKISKEIETFINKFSSIPGFIANMTLENFQKQEN